MSAASRIEWTESTWNPVTGCTKASEGCLNCYAEVMSRRLKAMGQPNYANGFSVTLHPHMLEVPRRWKKPQTVFVNSMSDLFHEGVPAAFISRVIDTIVATPHHTYQVLTKRAERLAALGGELDWPDNLWVGVTVENARHIDRIEHLRRVPAAVRFLSLEPLLGPIPRLPLEDIDWVIVGGESGPKARPLDAAWVRDLRDQCVRASVPFFFKQWGGVRKKAAGRMLDGRTWNELPRDRHHISTH